MMLPSPFNLIPNSARRERVFNPGDLVFRQGDQTRGLFFVVSGNIELRRYTKAGQSVIIHRAKSGETFAEASLFSPSYHCDATALTPSRLVELDRKVILNRFHNETEFALAIAKRFASQNQGYRRRLELLAIKSAEQRVMTALSEGLLTGSVKSFASDINLTHEVVYRTLAKLVTKGLLIKTGRGKYFAANKT